MKHQWKNRHIPGEMSYKYCRSCGLIQNPKNTNRECKGNPGIRPFGTGKRLQSTPNSEETMDTAKIYHDSEGNERTIHQMVKCEPDWAANRIQAGEKAIEQLEKLKTFERSLYEKCPDMKEDGLGEFDGYFTSYDNFIKRISMAWDHAPCYNNDPFELITDLINERDDALEPELNDETRWILGRPNFICGGLAPGLRLLGIDIPFKAEEEQAAAIHWMLCLYKKHGNNWKYEGSKLIKAAKEKQSAI